MISGRQIVCIASNWHDHPTSKHHVMRLLAEQNDVIWVNYHASRRPRLSGTDTRLIWRRIRQALRPPERVLPRLTVLSPLLIPLPASPLARRINGWLLARQIRSALRASGDASHSDTAHAARPVQLWLFAPDIPEVIRPLGAERKVYYCVDDFAGFSGYDAALVERLEAATVAASDLVVATSPELFEARRRQHTRVHLVSHGVDYEHFAVTPTLPAHEIPLELRGHPRPVFGYMGLISDYVDLALLAAAARNRPDWSFVLVGEARCELGELAGLSNVHVLGGRSYADLPRYCRGFDVGLIPFRMSRLTRAVNPIKLREYLAAGLPVVSSPMTAVLPYRPAVQTAETLPEFLAACEAALEQAAHVPAVARQVLVRDEGWRRRITDLALLVQELPLTPTGAQEQLEHAPAGDPVRRQVPVAV
ncbi:MAG: glycosyltransferase [Phycisphaerales bacterium]|nr:glycosyltransferase [Phycisphaerales bacterium]